MQPLDLVRPPRDRHLAPFRQYSRMMAFFLGQITHHVRESERGNKVFKGEDAPRRLTPSTSITRHSGTCGCKSAISASVSVGSPPRHAVHFNCVSSSITYV